MHILNRIRHLLLIASTVVATAGAQERSLEVIDLKHRPASEIVPIVEPFLPEGDVIRGSGFQLIVQATPETMQRVQEILERVDVAPRPLLITVRREDARDSRDQGTRVEVETGKDGTRGSVRSYSTARRDDEEAVQRVQVLEGRTAFIETGQSVPLAERSIALTPHGTVVQDGIRYHTLTSGFYVLPVVSPGNRVTLRISPRKEALSAWGGGVVDVQQAVTSVTGELGEWIDIGGTGREAETAENSVIARTHDRERSRIQVKVEEIEPRAP